MPSKITFPRTRILDLSYSINASLPRWPGDKRVFEARINATVRKHGYFTRSFWMLEHYGTHLDAPVHFPPGKTPVDKIPPEKLFGPAVVIDVRKESRKDSDYRLRVDRIARWEKKHGRIPRGAIVLLRTGWASRWFSEKRYRNMDRRGAMHFPGFSVESVRLLIRRKISGLGIDTMNVDYGASRDFAIHTLALGAGLYHLENLADLGALPESGALLVVAPIKLEGGSGGPCRVFALLPVDSPKNSQLTRNEMSYADWRARLSRAKRESKKGKGITLEAFVKKEARRRRH